MVFPGRGRRVHCSRNFCAAQGMGAAPRPATEARFGALYGKDAGL